MFVIEEELKKLPQKPGVYLMHDAQDNALSLLWITALIIIGSELQTNIHPSTKGGVLCSF